MPKPDPKLASLKDLIEKQFQKLRPEKSADLTVLRAHWKSLLGESIAENTQPLFIRGTVLHVQVVNSQWHCELTWLKAELIQKINAHVGLPTPLTDIRFVLANGKFL